MLSKYYFCLTLASRMQIMSINQLFSPCNYCMQNFTIAINILFFKKVTNDLLFPCWKCDKLLISDLKLKKHNNFHHNPDANKCDTCSNQISLISHKLVKHSQENNHCCDVCKAGFVSDKILKNHIEFVHEKKHQFACPYCQTVMSRKSMFTQQSQSFHEGKKLLS